jgi:hypothetical protein
MVHINFLKKISFDFIQFSQPTLLNIHKLLLHMSLHYKTTLMYPYSPRAFQQCQMYTLEEKQLFSIGLYN